MRELLPLKVLDLGMCARLGFLFYNGSSAILSHGRSNESCLSKDQREAHVMSSTKVNQIHGRVVEFGS